MTWNDVTIEHFAEIQKILEDEPPEGATVNEVNLHVHNTKKLIAEVLTDKSIEEIDEMLVGELEDIHDFICSDLPLRMHKRYKVNGITYQFTPDATELNSGSYISIMEEIKGNPFNTLHKVMFNIGKPMKFGFRKKLIFIGWKRYNLKPHQIHKEIEAFKKMPISIANPIAVFFCSLSKDLTNVLEDYSLNQMKEMTNQMDNLALDLQDGDG